jgi:molybdenum cofactor cytidylyltransferase
MITILLLAAGASTRMGQSKQLLAVADEPLLLTSSRAAVQSAADQVVVVLGANEQLHRAVIEPLPVAIVYHENWQLGMGSSLKAGLNYILKSEPLVQAVLVMVCDQPMISSVHLTAIIRHYQQNKDAIVASTYAGMAGVPALFDHSLFPLLLSLPDDQGARKIIQQKKELVGTVGFTGGAIDLDTPEDFRRLTGREL